ncbi:unnamed protein product [Trichobilharzia regenti]|nr:unnamed protein product [Trichobilharzia regenti]
MSTENILRLVLLQLDRILEDPRVQIAGLREAYPFRMKGIIYYNEPAVMEVIFKLLTIWLRPKVRDRFIRVKDNIKKAYDKVPGLQAILPREYGGYNKPMEEILREQNADFKEYFLKGERLWRGMSVDERRRPESAKRLMSDYKEVDDRNMGTSGTFIRLPVND